MKHITPNRIDLEIGNKYSKLISRELQEVFSDAHIGDVIDRFFGDLFSCVPKNLSQVSDVLDCWLTEMPTVKEAMVDLFASLPRWGIPIIIDEVENMSPAKYLSQKKRDSLVINAYNFIKGKTYARVTKTTITKIQKQFVAYRGSDEKEPGKYFNPYPDGQALDTFDSLEKAVLLFVMGDRSEELCDKLIRTDFSILEDVLSLKLTGRSNPKPDPSAKRIAGMPLSVILRVMLSTLKNNQQGVDGVRITWKQSCRICG